MNLSVSQLALYRHCPKAYECKYILGIEEPVSEALEAGKAFHANIGLAKVEDEMVKTLLSDLRYQKFLGKITEFERKDYQFLDGFNFVSIKDAVGDNFILEFKSASKPWDEDKFLTEIQPHVYMYAEFVRTRTMKDFHYFIVTKPKYGKITIQHKQIKFDEFMWEEVKKSCRELVSDLEFNPTAYRKNDCFWCVFKNHCEVYF